MTHRVLSLGLILLATGPTWAEDELPEGITARAWAIADGRTGELLWSLNEDKPAKAASTTKMMCAWVVLRLAEHFHDVLKTPTTPNDSRSPWKGFHESGDTPKDFFRPGDQPCQPVGDNTSVSGTSKIERIANWALDATTPWCWIHWTS